MSGGIFLVQGDRLVEMTEQGYASEDLLQALIARFPSILAGDPGGTPRRWLLIKREMDLESEDDAGGRWSVDHVFVDQDAVPTLVEVKRSSDTRIRREVVGQMLDYAANAVGVLGTGWHEPQGREGTAGLHLGRDPSEASSDRGVPQLADESR